MSVDARAGALPDINTPVLVAVPEVDHDLPSRVEDVRGSCIVVAAVTVPGRPDRHRQGQIVTLAWAVPPRGLMSVACELVDARAQQPAAVGAAAVRAVPEAPAAPVHPRGRRGPGGRVRVTEWTVHGLLADLSEGGARVLLDAGQEVGATVGDTVQVEVQLPGQPVTTAAVLIGVDTLAAGRHQLRLQFDLSERDGERVRRAVMQRQVEARQREDR